MKRRTKRRLKILVYILFVFAMLTGFYYVVTRPGESSAPVPSSEAPSSVPAESEPPQIITASVAPGQYTSAQKVLLQSDWDAIYYTTSANVTPEEFAYDVLLDGRSDLQDPSFVYYRYQQQPIETLCAGALRIMAIAQDSQGALSPVYSFVYETLAEDYTIHWKNPLLEKKVREYLHLPQGEITRRQVDAIQSLRFIGRDMEINHEYEEFSFSLPRMQEIRRDTLENGFYTGYNMPDTPNPNGYRLNQQDRFERGKVDSWEDLIHFKNLNELEISYTHLSDLNQLQPLTKLQGFRNLTLKANPITDLSFLSRLSKLTSLHLGFVELEDWTPLAALEQLETVYLTQCGVEDFSFLVECTKVQALYSSFNPIQNLDALENLNNLAVLTVYQGEVEDLSPLAALKNLTRVNLSLNQIQDITPLQNAVNMTQLYLANNEIEDISALGFMSHLHTLDISANHIGALDALENCNDLVFFVARFNQITQLEPLQELHKLESVNLNGNYIQSVWPLAGCTSLRELRLSHNELTDIGALAGLKQIKTLHVNGNAQLSDIGVVENMEHLTSLSIGNTSVSNIEVLRHLRSLQEVYAKNTYIADWSPVQQVYNVER